MEYYDLTTTVPYDEPCIQLGDENYRKWAKLEGLLFIAQIKAEVGPPPEGVIFKLQANSHDFGTYYTVAIGFSDKDGQDYALKVDDESPANWSPLSRKKLQEAGYPVKEAW